MRANLTAISRELTNNVFMAKVRRRGKKLGVNLFNRARHGYVAQLLPQVVRTDIPEALPMVCFKKLGWSTQVGPHRRWMKGEL